MDPITRLHAAPEGRYRVERELGEGDEAEKNHPVLLLIIASLLLPLGWACDDDSTGPSATPVLQPSELCTDFPSTAIATFEDANLAEAVRAALSVGAQQDLTCGLISGLTVLNVRDVGIGSLEGIQNLTSLTELLVFGDSITDVSPLSGLTRLTVLAVVSNRITDISPLSGLTNLTALALQGNTISDISALSGLASLTGVDLSGNTISDISAMSGLSSLEELWLLNNSITDISAVSGLTSLTVVALSVNSGLSDIQPLLDNPGLGAGDIAYLMQTNVTCTDVALLEAKGVDVNSDCG
jgi:Leucine-rich repeat (LRR) protein